MRGNPEQPASRVTDAVTRLDEDCSGDRFRVASRWIQAAVVSTEYVSPLPG